MNNDFQLITSVKNPKVQHVRRLKDKSYRRQCGEFLIEGENFIKDLPLDAEISALFVEKNKFEGFKYIVNQHAGREIYLVDENVMTAMSDTVTPCGILATVKIKACADEIIGNVAVLDGISDPGNMGTIIRTCAACGVQNILAIDSVDYLSPKVIRSSMGGIFKVKIIEKTRQEALKMLSCHSVYSLDMNGESIYKIDEISQPYAIVVGNESHGVSEELRRLGKVISLPMTGGMESLNAAVSMSIALYEIAFGKN